MAIVADLPAADIARRWVDDGLPPLTPLRGADALATARALKDLCYAAWSTEPPRAARAAEVLRQLAEQQLALQRLNAPPNAQPNAQPPAATQEAAEIHALAAWTGGIAELTRGRMAEAVPLLDRAHDGFTALVSPGLAAQTQVPKIIALSMLGRHAEATACAERTQQAFIALGDRRAAGRVSLNLGSLHLRHDAYAESARHYREAAVLFARVGDAEHSVMADIGVADALTALGDADEAMRMYQRARMRSATHQFPVLAALAEESVALLELTRGHYREALSGFEASRRGYEALAMPQHLAVAEKQLADAYLALRLLPEALALYDAALPRFEALDMPEDQAWTLAQRGRAQGLLGRPLSAADSFDRAARLFHAQELPVGEAAVVLARAESSLLRGDGAAAQQQAEVAAAGFAGAGLVHSQARAALLRGQALLQQGASAQAHDGFAALLAQARAQGWLTLQVQALAGQGQAALMRGDAGDARSAFEAAVALAEDQRRALPGDDLRSAFLTDQLQAYQGLVALALQAHDEAPGSPRAASVLVQLERCRARALGERLARAQSPDSGDSIHSADSADVGDHWDAQATRGRLNWLYRRVQRLQDEGEPSPLLEQEIRHTEHTLLEQARRQRLSATGAPRRDGAAAEPEAVVADLQRVLGPQEALVEFGVVGDELLALVVTRGQVRLQRRLCTWAEVQDAARQLRFQLETLRHGSAALAAHQHTLVARSAVRLQRLHALAWSALAPQLAGIERVLIVAPGILGSLPFAALHDGTMPLAQRHTLALATSAEIALRGLQRLAVPAHTVLALGESSRLPHAAQEAEQVRSLFTEGRACTGDQATLQALVQHAGAADVLHLACHARFRDDNPMFSALHLADGALTVELAERLLLRPGIVVLSACETGLSDSGAGDEMVGLVRAFLVAGAARVLASLWPVDDAMTARFMKHFYRALQRNASPAAALQQAQATMRSEAPHPAHWAAFVLHGGW